MATTLVVLALIATTLLSIGALFWATIYYVPRILDGDDHAEDAGASAGRPS